MPPDPLKSVLAQQLNHPEREPMDDSTLLARHDDITIEAQDEFPDLSLVDQFVPVVVDQRSVKNSA
jgi:hypothetical protein